MEGYAVPREVFEEVKKKERSSSSESNFFTSENIKECANLCRQLGITAKQSLQREKQDISQLRIRIVAFS